MSTGSFVAKRYRLGKRLGGGGFGEVFEARHEVTGQKCAVKLLVRGTADDRGLRRLTRESQLGARVDDAHAVTVLDAGVDGGVPFLVMELLEGEDLGRRLARAGKFSPAETVGFLAHAAQALATAHREGIVHRDLKPNNLFLTVQSDGRPWVKILDFGTAKLCDGERAGTTTVAAGTPLYMAPELFETDVVTSAVDIYALGMCAFEMLTGTHYYALEQRQSVNAFALGALLVKGPPESAAARAARYQHTVPARFDRWFAQCTARDPKNRPEDVVAAVDGLRRCLRLTAETLEALIVVRPPADIPEDTEPEETQTLQPASIEQHRPRSPQHSTNSTKRARSVRMGVVVLGGALALLGVTWFASPTRAPSVAAPPRSMVGVTRFGYAAPAASGSFPNAPEVPAPSVRPDALRPAPPPPPASAMTEPTSSPPPRLWTRE